MKLEKRIKRIVSLTIEDFYNSGKSSSESKESLNSWLCDELSTISNIEDYYTYEMSIKVLDMLKSLDLVDVGFIMELMADDVEPSEISIKFEVVL